MSQLTSQLLLDAAFFGMQTGIGIYDLEGQLTSCNEEFHKHKNAFLLSDEQLHHVMKTGKAERKLLEGNHDTVLESYVSPYANEQGETIGYIYRLTDVTSVTAPSREQELEALFLDNVSYELRTPLNALIGFNDLLNGVSGLHMEENEKLKMKEHIHRNADRLITVVNDIVDMAEMRKGCLPLHKTVVSLMEVCYKARESVKPIVKLGVKLKHEFPIALKDTYIYTDGKRLEQLLRNIMMNACQHTTSGTVTLKVKTFEDEESGREMLQLRVDDTGEGILMEQYEQVFRPFYKINSESEGIGIGLTVCREIARMLSGRVYIDKEYEGGTSFVFEMPFDAI